MTSPRVRHILRAATTAGLVALLVLLNAPAAWAHAELVEADPARSSTVGGPISTISLQFVGLAHPGDHDVTILDPLDNPVEVLAFDQDFNRLDLTVPTLSVEGEYIVRYRTTGADQDEGVGEFSFTYDADAPPPDGITALQQGGTGLRIDGVTITLMALTGISILVWLVYVARRLRQPTGESGDLDNLDDDENGLVGSD